MTMEFEVKAELFWNQWLFGISWNSGWIRERMGWGVYVYIGPLCLRIGHDICA
jgi:hypothetical protein